MFTLVLTSLPLRPIVLSSKNSQLMRSILRFSSFIFRLHENYLLILRKSKMKLEFFGGMMKSISNEKMKKSIQWQFCLCERRKNLLFFLWHLLALRFCVCWNVNITAESFSCSNRSFRNSFYQYSSWFVVQMSEFVKNIWSHTHGFGFVFAVSNFEIRIQFHSFSVRSVESKIYYHDDSSTVTHTYTALYICRAMKFDVQTYKNWVKLFFGC